MWSVVRLAPQTIHLESILSRLRYGSVWVGCKNTIVFCAILPPRPACKKGPLSPRKTSGELAPESRRVLDVRKRWHGCSDFQKGSKIDDSES